MSVYPGSESLDSFFFFLHGHHHMLQSESILFLALASSSHVYIALRHVGGSFPSSVETMLPSEDNMGLHMQGRLVYGPKSTMDTTPGSCKKQPLATV